MSSKVKSDAKCCICNKGRVNANGYHVHGVFIGPECLLRSFGINPSGITEDERDVLAERAAKMTPSEWSQHVDDASVAYVERMRASTIAGQIKSGYLPSDYAQRAEAKRIERERKSAEFRAKVEANKAKNAANKSAFSKLLDKLSG